MGVVFLDVDGSVVSNPGPSGFGGLVCNSEGVFLRGFYGFYGVSVIIHAEIMAIVHGL